MRIWTRRQNAQVVDAKRCGTLVVKLLMRFIHVHHYFF